MAETIDVLHVDDDPSVIDLTTAFLREELEDVDVTGVTDPTTVLERIEDGDFDCVISDYDMPRLDGLELLAELRDEHNDLPFVLYTGKGSEEIASRAVNAGVTGYFQKGGPDQQRRLANRVQQAVEEYRTRRIAERYSTVIEALGYPVYVVDEEGRFRFVNEPFVELTGYDRDTIIGSKPGLIKDDEAVQEAEDRLGTILSSSGPDVERFGVDIVPKEGDPIPCRDHMAVLPYEGEEFEGSVGILRDVSDERRRQRDLEIKEQAMDEAPVGITLSDPSKPDNPMSYLNDRFVEITGYSREEALGRNCRFLQGPNTVEEHVAELRRAVDAGEPTSVTMRNYRRDGTMFWNRVSIAPLRDDDGEIVNWVGFQEDVTDYKRRERELQRQNERLEEFAGIVSHDLRNPLNVARGRVELARETGETDHLGPAEDALDRMETIVEDTLELAREGDSVADPEPVDLGSVVAASWDTVETTNADLVSDAEATIRADPDRLRNLFENLFRNAVEHGVPDDATGDGKVTVRVGRLDDGFFVEDDGPGIPEDRREDVFDAGHTTDEDGTGFGLAIVREIANAHDWQVRATESSAGGVRFEITGVEAS